MSARDISMKKYLLPLIASSIFATIFLIAPTAFAAISWDSAGSWTTGSSVSSITISQTIGGSSNEMLFVLSLTTNNDASATYNGVSMTKIATSTGTGDGRFLSLFYLPSPTAGTNNIVIAGSGSEAVIQGGGSAYSGVSSVIDAATSSAINTNVTTFTSNVTSTVNNDWSILGARLNNVGASAIGTGTNMFFRANSTFTALGDSSGTFPIGNVSTTVIGVGGNGTFYTVMAAFSPASVSNPGTDVTISSGVTIKSGVTIR